MQLVLQLNEAVVEQLLAAASYLQIDSVMDASAQVLVACMLWPRYQHKVRAGTMQHCLFLLCSFCCTKGAVQTCASGR